MCTCTSTHTLCKPHTCSRSSSKHPASAGSAQVLMDMERARKDGAASKDAERAEIQRKAWVPAHSRVHFNNRFQSGQPGLSCQKTGSEEKTCTGQQARTWSIAPAASALPQSLQPRLPRWFAQAAIYCSQLEGTQATQSKAQGSETCLPGSDSVLTLLRSVCVHTALQRPGHHSCKHSTVLCPSATG